MKIIIGVLQFLRKIFRKEQCACAITVDIRRYNNGETVIYPRVRIGQSFAQDLEKAINGQGWVNFQPMNRYVSVILHQGASPEQVKQQMINFLLLNSGRWLPGKPDK